jgi:hypothetical protein
MIFNTDYDYENKPLTGYEYLCLSLQIQFNANKEYKQTLESPYEPGSLEIWEVKIEYISGDSFDSPDISDEIIKKIEKELLDNSNFIDRIEELISEELADSEAFYLSEKYDRKREEKFLKD